MSKLITLFTVILLSLSAWAEDNWRFTFTKDPYPSYILTASGSEDVNFKMSCFDAGINFGLKKLIYPVKMRWMKDQSITVKFNHQDDIVIPIMLGANRYQAMVWVGANLFAQEENKAPLTDETLPQLKLFLEELYQTKESDTLTFTLPTSEDEILISEFSAIGAKRALIEFSDACPNFSEIMKITN